MDDGKRGRGELRRQKDRSDHFRGRVRVRDAVLDDLKLSEELRS